MKLNVQGGLEEAVIGVECVNVLTTSLVQLVNAVTLDVIAVNEANVPIVSMVQDLVNVILPTLVLIASAQKTFVSIRTIQLLASVMAMESVIPALHNLVALVTQCMWEHCAT